MAKQRKKKNYGGVTRQAVWERFARRRAMQEGLCPRCKVNLRDFNFKKGKPYSKCPECRQTENARSKVLMQRLAARRKGAGA